MCLAVPVRVTEILSDSEALVELSGTQKTVNIDLVDDLHVGDYVILHVGYALQKVDPERAERTLSMFSSEGAMPE